MSITLTAQKRDILGKRVKRLRKEGLVPAELFGPETENRHLSISEKEFNRVFREAGTNTIVDVVLEGEKEPVSVFIYDAQLDALSKRPLHVDLYHVSKTVKTHALVPVVFRGEAPAEKKDCIIVHVTGELHVEAFPQDMPHEFSVDVSSLENEGDTVTLKDLDIPANVEVEAEPDLVIAIAEAKRAEEVETPAVAAEEMLSKEDVKETSEEAAKEKEKK